MTAFAGPAPSPPCLLDGYIREKEMNMTILCHDRTFKRVTVIDDASGLTLFTVESKGAASMSWRRAILDGSGRKLFELRHMGYAMKNDWAVEDLDGKRICSLKHVKTFSGNRSELNATIHQSSGGCGMENAVVEVRPKDQGALSTIVQYQGAAFATILNTEANDVVNLEAKGLDRTVWKAHVNGGTDLCLALVVVLCLAEMEHVWRQ